MLPVGLAMTGDSCLAPLGLLPRELWDQIYAYHHLTKIDGYCQVVAIIKWVVPLVFSGSRYLAIVQGRSSSTARILLEDFCCIGPYLSPKNEIPWYLNPLNPQWNPANRSEIRILTYIERINDWFFNLHRLREHSVAR